MKQTMTPTHRSSGIRSRKITAANTIEMSGAEAEGEQCQRNRREQRPQPDDGCRIETGLRGTNRRERGREGRGGKDKNDDDLRGVERPLGGHVVMRGE